MGGSKGVSSIPWVKLSAAVMAGATAVAAVVAGRYRQGRAMMLGVQYATRSGDAATGGRPFELRGGVAQGSVSLSTPHDARDDDE